MFPNCLETEVFEEGHDPHYRVTEADSRVKPQPCKTATLLSEPSWEQRKYESTPKVSLKKAVLGCHSRWAGRQSLHEPGAGALGAKPSAILRDLWAESQLQRAGWTGQCQSRSSQDSPSFQGALGRGEKNSGCVQALPLSHTSLSGSSDEAPLYRQKD